MNNAQLLDLIKAGGCDQNCHTLLSEAASLV